MLGCNLLPQYELTQQNRIFCFRDRILSSMQSKAYSSTIGTQ